MHYYIFRSVSFLILKRIDILSIIPSKFRLSKKKKQ